MCGLKLMFRGVEFSIRFSAEQKNKLFSPCTTFFEVQQNWHKTQFSQFSIASIELGVGWFFCFSNNQIGLACKITNPYIIASSRILA